MPFFFFASGYAQVSLGEKAPSAGLYVIGLLDLVCVLELLDADAG